MKKRKRKRDLSGWFLARNVIKSGTHTDSTVHPHTHTHRKRVFFWLPTWFSLAVCELYYASCAPACVHVPLCVFYLCVCAFECVSVPLPPTLASNMVIDNRGKRWRFCRQRGWMCWPEHPATKKIARSVGWGECAERKEIYHKLNRLGLLTDTPLFYFFSSSLLLPLFLFSLLFFSEGCLPLKQGELIFLIPPPPTPLLLFNTPLPSPTPCSPNQYSIYMYAGIKYKRTLEQCHSGAAAFL